MASQLMPRLHVVDGTYELFRAHFSKRPDHRAPAGWNAKATTGLVSSLLYLLNDSDEQVTHVAVAFDNPIESFRNDLFDGYKTGVGLDPELLAQFTPAEEATRALGIVVWVMDRWEADDALATAAARFRDQFDQIRIMTPDKDLGQCIRGQHVVQIDRLRQKLIDEPALRTLRGIGPRSIPDLLALVGDTADGIPGLPGIGATTASALLGHYEHLENIPADPRTWGVKVRGADKIAATLVEHREAALLYRKLATLVEDVPLPQDAEGLAHRGVPRGDFIRWCDRLGVESLKTRPIRWSD